MQDLLPFAAFEVSFCVTTPESITESVLVILPS